MEAWLRDFVRARAKQVARETFIVNDTPYFVQRGSWFAQFIGLE